MRARQTTKGDKRSGKALRDARGIWLSRIVTETDPRSPARAALVDQMAEAVGPKKSRIYQLIPAYEEQGIKALERPPRSDKGKTRCDGAVREAWAKFATDPRWADRPVSVRADGFRKEWAATHAGDVTDIPSVSTLRKWLKGVDDAMTMTPREAKRARKRRLRITAAYANHVWQADQRQADFQVIERFTDPQTGEQRERRFRPLLFTFLDVYSGAVMGGGYYEGRHTAYGTQIVEAALLDAIYRDPDGLPLCGLPEFIYWDNGAPHRSRWMDRFAKSCGIELVNSQPAEPETHGLIEGWHHILKDRFEGGLPGFLGGDNRKENRTLQMRLWDEGAAPEPEWLTLDQANAEFRTWLLTLHHQAYHGGNPAGGVDTSRYGRWTASAIQHPERRQVPRPEDLEWRRMHIADKPRRVTGGAVQFCNVDYTAPILGAWNGLWLQVHYLPAAPQRIWLAAEDGELVCVAEPRDIHIFRSFESRFDLKAALAEVKETRRLAKERADILAAGAEQGLVPAEHAAAAAQAAETTLTPLEEATLRRQQRERARQEDNVIHLPLPGVAPKELVPERKPAAADPLFDDALATAAEASRTVRRGGDLFD